MTRWFIVHADTGHVAKGQPMDGFATREEAEDFHRNILRGDPQLEVRLVEIP